MLRFSQSQCAEKRCWTRRGGCTALAWCFSPLSTISRGSRTRRIDTSIYIRRRSTGGDRFAGCRAENSPARPTLGPYVRQCGGNGVHPIRLLLTFCPEAFTACHPPPPIDVRACKIPESNLVNAMNGFVDALDGMKLVKNQAPNRATLLHEMVHVVPPPTSARLHRQSVWSRFGKRCWRPPLPQCS
jgi:hypothetical protein